MPQTLKVVFVFQGFEHPFSTLMLLKNITLPILQAEPPTCKCTGKPGKGKGGKDKKGKEETAEDKLAREEKEKLKKDTADAKKVGLDHQLTSLQVRI